MNIDQRAKTGALQGECGRVMSFEERDDWECSVLGSRQIVSKSSNEDPV